MYDQQYEFRFSLRKQFGTDMLRNGIHASSSIESAKEEISIFWGDVHFDEEGLFLILKLFKNGVFCRLIIIHPLVKYQLNRKKYSRVLERSSVECLPCIIQD